MIAGLVLAAGAGERFGGGKQLAQLRGRPLLEHALVAMAEAPVDERVVVLGAGAAAVQAQVPLHGARPVVCDGWAEGQSASLRAGIEAVAHADAVVVALGDQPLIAPEAIARVLAARDGRAAAVRASYNGVPAHPIVLERVLFPDLVALRGDTGARAVLSRVLVRDVACDGLGLPTDVDTPDQLVEVLQR